MQSKKSLLVVCLLAASGLLLMNAPLAHAGDGQGAVFVMTNAASGNQIDIFARNEDGALRAVGSVAPAATEVAARLIRCTPRARSVSAPIVDCCSR
jgi:hypothetical protein